MQTALIDFVPGRHAEPSDAVLAAANLVVWDPAALLVGPFDGVDDAGRPVLSPDRSQQVLARARRLREAFRRLLRRGGALVVLLPPPVEIGVHTLQEIVGFAPLEALPEPVPRLGPVTAEPVEPRRVAAEPVEPGPARDGPAIIGAGAPFRAFFDTVGPLLAPRSTLEGGGTPIAITRAGTDRTVAGYAYRHPGRLLLLPAPADGIGPDDRTALLAAIETLVARLTLDRAGDARPDWSVAAPLPVEAAAQARVDGLRRTLVETEAALDRAERALGEVRRVAALAFGGREAVALALADAVGRFGGYVQPVGDADEVVVERDGRIGVFVIMDGRGRTPLVQACAAAGRHAADLGVPVVPILLSVAEHGLPPAARHGPSAAERAAAAAAGVVFADGAALLDAWQRGDPTLLARWLEGVEGAEGVEGGAGG